MHYNTFPRIEADPEEFAGLVGEMFTEVKILSPGDEYEF
jgi:L-ascorbate metabolism protein UlaG (beta-lactamase superfamily)